MNYYAVRMDGLHQTQYVHRFETAQNYALDARWTDCLEMIYITSGRWHIAVAEEDYECPPDSVLFLPPQTRQSVQLLTAEGGHLCIGLHLQQDGVLCSAKDYGAALQYHPTEFSYEWLVHLPIYLEPERGKDFLQPFQEAYALFYSPNPGSNLLVNSLMHLMLAQVSAQSAARFLAQKQSPPRELQKAIEISQYLRAHYTQAISLERLGEIFHLNPSYLCTMFRQKIGYTITEYLNIQRVEAAKYYLIQTGKSIQEIAQIVGVFNEFYFSRLFKKVEGCTPTNYRKRYTK